MSRPSQALTRKPVNLSLGMPHLDAESEYLRASFFTQLPHVYGDNCYSCSALQGERTSRPHGMREQSGSNVAALATGAPPGAAAQESLVAMQQLRVPALVRLSHAQHVVDERAAAASAASVLARADVRRSSCGGGMVGQPRGGGGGLGDGRARVLAGGAGARSTTAAPVDAGSDEEQLRQCVSSVRAWLSRGGEGHHAAGASSQDTPPPASVAWPGPASERRRSGSRSAWPGFPAVGTPAASPDTLVRNVQPRASETFSPQTHQPSPSVLLLPGHCQQQKVLAPPPPPPLPPAPVSTPGDERSALMCAIRGGGARAGLRHVHRPSMLAPMNTSA